MYYGIGYTYAMKYPLFYPSAGVTTGCWYSVLEKALFAKFTLKFSLKFMPATSLSYIQGLVISLELSLNHNFLPTLSCLDSMLPHFDITQT